MTTGAHAPGWPGIPARWTSSAKSGVGTALGSRSRVWFTISHGILNEVYYPRLDRACTRDLGFIITGDAGFFSEVKRHAVSTTTTTRPGVPAYSTRSVCTQGRYTLDTLVFADPFRDTVIQRVVLTPTTPGDRLCLFALLAPHLGNGGANNTAIVLDYKGDAVLAAERDGDALALMSSSGWLARSAGFVGASDGWRDVKTNGRLTELYQRAERGNTALTGEIDAAAAREGVVLALGFGTTVNAASLRARTTLHESWEELLAVFTHDWEKWMAGHNHPALSGLARTSAAVLRTHEAKGAEGAIIASLSIPWGDTHGDEDLGGYHLVWPRDLVEVAGGLLAIGDHRAARRVVRFLRATQEEDGRWPQNMWLDGTPYWNGIQMDEAALPILLVDLLRREGALTPADLLLAWPMVRRAAAFILRNGPVTPQDRWEEEPGYAPFTIAAEVAALAVAADLARYAGQPSLGVYLDETADTWYAGIDRWMYVRGTALAQQCNVDGYYLRIAPPSDGDVLSAEAIVVINNQPPGRAIMRAGDMVSPDALSLVRFGLRSATDPRIVNTVRVIDALLQVDTPDGPAWRRYNGDGYGEHEDGAPFDGTGVGRAWPLLTGERGHYEVAAGNIDRARELLVAMERFAGESGLIPEQIWDGPDVPGRELVFGKASGSARPLVWAHAEYLKLARAIQDGQVFDLPSATRRFRDGSATCTRAVWRFNHRIRTLNAGMALRIETAEPALVHWSSDGWHTAFDTPTADSGLSMHVANFATEDLAVGSVVQFTFFWPGMSRWEQSDFAVAVVDAG
ncbi:MAG: glycoside hydrolase family 15 protein [Vicinamibacterales bacterium]